MDAAGRTLSRSSSDPTRTTITSGRPLEQLNNCVPQVGQKQRRMVLPLLAML
jgi:hypothetical protein